MAVRWLNLGKIFFRDCDIPGWTFGRAFEEGSDIVSELDLRGARRPNREQRRVNVGFPAWMIEARDQEAARLGVTGQSIIKVWIAERIDAA